LNLYKTVTTPEKETVPEKDDYRSTIKEAVADKQTFLRLIVSGVLHGEVSPWSKAVVRPVELQEKLGFQLTHYDKKQGIAKNYSDAEIGARLDELLALPFNQMHVQATSGDLHVRITKKRKALIRRGKPSRSEQTPQRAHNRVKRYPIPSDAPDAFLQGIGIMDQDGHVKPTMQDKFRQINEFLKLLHETVLAKEGCEDLAGKRINFIDCGCGNAYLTFAGFHYLNHIHGLTAHITGVDTNPVLIEKCEKLRDSLGWSGLDFVVSRIVDFTPEMPPDVVLSLHACNTATDEAIAKGVQWGSRVILAAPCCQHELRQQIEAPLFGPVLRHGILKQRTAEILTDSCRAQVLRIMGYSTDVVQFIDSKHTPKNLMIRAKQAQKPGDKDMVRDYKELRDYWKIEPSIERMLQGELAPYMG
jgi:hypothetical protein